MKATEILEWIIRESIEGEFLNSIEVPDEYDEITPQTEEWWLDMFGGCPPHPIASGKYLYYYASSVSDMLAAPDAEIELNDDYIYLYFIED